MTIIASAENYYNNQTIITNKDSLGWEKIVKQIDINEELTNKEIGIYLYNPQDQYVYFDNFKITIFAPYNFDQIIN